MTDITFTDPAGADALRTCNSCGYRQMLASEEGPTARGYCQVCIDQPSGLAEIDLRCTGTTDLEWLRHHAQKAGYLDDVATLTAELERRVTP